MLRPATPISPAPHTTTTLPTTPTQAFFFPLPPQFTTLGLDNRSQSSLCWADPATTLHCRDRPDFCLSCPSCLCVFLASNLIIILNPQFPASLLSKFPTKVSHPQSSLQSSLFMHFDTPNTAQSGTLNDGDAYIQARQQQQQNTKAVITHPFLVQIGLSVSS
jgi:hypothetical protein